MKQPFMDRFRIIIADDHQLLLAGLRAVLEPQFEVVGVAVDGRSLVSEVEKLKPDLVVLDIAMPQLNGIEAARQIKKAAPNTKLIFVTQQMDRQYVEAAFRAGASGYVLKQSFLNELNVALRQVQEGHFYITQSLAKDIPDALFDPNRNPADLFHEGLTRRQREVLQLVAEGKAIKEIANIMGISPKTVAFHKAGIMDELGLRTTAELTRYALEHGLLSSDYRH
jgi:DNA-binding NarL/FixJ family response regulator